MVIYSSCSNNNIETGKMPNSTELIEQKLYESEMATIGHNIMLNNLYLSLKKKPISVNRNIMHDDTALDSCISLFISANKDVFLEQTITRGKSNLTLTHSFLKECVNGDFALNESNSSTRVTPENEKEIPAFLLMFYNEFFNSEEVSIDHLNEEILTTVEKVKKVYPNLTSDELEGLLFVAGVTYNSCIYWYNNSGKWVSLLTQKQETRSNWLWTGVKNEVKKWAKADGGGAIKVWTANKLAGVASGGAALLAGAAIGSAVGAWNNLPIWD